jgi:hypothetical protein
MFINDEHNNKVNISMNKTNKNTEEKILNLALEAFRKNVTAPANIAIMNPEPDYIEAFRFRPDRRAKIKTQGKTLDYYAEIKANIAKANIFQWLMYKDKLDHPLLIITNYINAQMADRLKLGGLEFIDTAGNAFINNPPLYIFVKGNRPPEFLNQPPLERAFKPSGLKIVFAFLCNPGFENKAYREIAAAADVALGTVGWIMRDLKRLGFLLDMSKRGRRLTNKANLLNRWVNTYPERLRPKQMIGRYKGDSGWWQNKTLDPMKALWGSEMAAARLTQYLKPGLITVYVAPHAVNQILFENRLKKDAAGDVEILERFWTPAETRANDDIVHPILVYADLLATGNQRNIEAAKMIYEQYIIRLVRED